MGIGAALILLAIGAILAFAIQIDSTPVAGVVIQWDVVGVILMVIGIIGLAWSLYLMSSMRRRGAGVVPGVRGDETIIEQHRRDNYVG